MAFETGRLKTSFISSHISYLPSLKAVLTSRREPRPLRSRLGVPPGDPGGAGSDGDDMHKGESNKQQTS